MLPFLNVVTNTALARSTSQHNRDTLKAHAEASGTDPCGREWFEAFLAKAPFSIVVFYRGLW